MKGKVYISGPVSGLDKAEVRRRFAEAEQHLKHNGYTVFNPCDTHLPPDASHGMYMNEDIKQMPSCDIVYFLKGWERSHGCRYEHQVALATERRICYEDPDSYTLPTLSKREIFNLVARSLGMAPWWIQKRDNHRKMVTVRMAVVSYLYCHKDFTIQEIAQVMQRSECGVRWLLRHRLKYKVAVDQLVQHIQEQSTKVYPTPEEG